MGIIQVKDQGLFTRVRIIRTEPVGLWLGHSELKTTIPGLVSVFSASSLQNVFDYNRTDWSFTIPRTLAIAVYHTVTRIILPYIRTTQTSTQLSGSPPAHYHRATLSHVLHKLSINGTNPLCLQQPETSVTQYHPSSPPLTTITHLYPP